MRTDVVEVFEPGRISEGIRRAVEVLGSGGMVAFPTDTVYGVGVRVLDEAAIRRLYRAKGRSLDKPIPVLLANLEQLPEIALGPMDRALQLGERYWPGPLTLVLRRHPNLPAIVSSTDTVGVRIPDHPVALALLAAAGPMAVSSANRSGETNPRTAADVVKGLGGRIDLILDGSRTPGGQPSTVVDCTGERLQILRAGPIPAEELQDL
jgi:L-threonylcarbamoyladenylate synthase